MVAVSPEHAKGGWAIEGGEGAGELEGGLPASGSRLCLTQHLLSEEGGVVSEFGPDLRSSRTHPALPLRTPRSRGIHSEIARMTSSVCNPRHAPLSSPC